MITDQPINNHDDMRKVTDNVLRDAGLAIEESGGKVTFAGKEPVRKTVMKAGASAAIILAANAVADAAIWKERSPGSTRGRMSEYQYARLGGICELLLPVASGATSGLPRCP